MEVFPFVSSSENLTDLRDLFLTSIGPHGRLKVLVTSADQVRVTSTSDRIVATVFSSEVLQDPFAEAVGQLVRGHLATWGDFGLTLGILICDLVKSFNENFDVLAIKNVRKVFDESLKEVLALNRLKIDFGNLNQILSVLKTILNAKPIVKSGRTSANDKEHFLKKVAAKILEGFLKTIPEFGEIEFDLGLVVQTGNDTEAEIRDGYFYPAPDIAPETEFIFESLKSGKRVRLIAMNVKVQNDLSDTLGDDDVTFERHGFENFENEFLKMKMEELARFCVRNEGKMKKISIRVFVRPSANSRLI